MGKIKGEKLLRKQDRPRTELKPPSMRRIKRRNHSSVDSSRSGRNNTLTPSRIVSLRGLRRRGKDSIIPSGTFAQPDDSAAMARFKGMADDGLGKIETKKAKVIRHRVDKQDGNFKFHKHDFKS